MPIEITMPRVSEDATDGILVAWRVGQGEPVARGQVVAEVETDKAVVELEAPTAGVLAFQAAQPGQCIAAGGLVAALAAEGESVEDVRDGYAHRAGPEAAMPARGPEAGGSCPADVLRAIPICGTRRAVATRMLRSTREMPQYHVTVDCDAEALVTARRALKRKKQTRNVQINAILLKCAAAALKVHPMVNATIVGDVIYQHARFDIAVAVAVADGVVAPVVREVAGRSLAEISAELDALVEAARGRRLRREQLQGGTFTVSALGSYGVHDFTAIVIPPQVAILAVGAIREVPVIRDGAVVPGQRIALTLSADHRAVDGAVAADFMRTLQSVVEDPEPALR